MLRVHDISKQFGATQALAEATFECKPGQVHALLGENGAGKSTLVKMLSGVLRPDRGFVEMNGVPQQFRSPAEARRAGVGTAFQELSLVPHMTVAQNLLLGEEPKYHGFVSRRGLNAKAVEVLLQHGVDDLDPEQPVHLLPLAQQQKLEIVKAMHNAAAVCILDESTSALASADVKWFYARVAELRKAGIVVIFITHRLGEVRQLCDEVTVLRRGTSVGTYQVAEISDDDLVTQMLGEPLAAAFPPRPPARDASAPVLLEVQELRKEPELRGTSLEVREGEIVGVAALQGHGQEGLFRALFGISSGDSGTIKLGGRKVHFHSPRDAIRLGVSFVPENRKTEGLFLRLSGTENLAITSLHKVSKLGWVLLRRERAAVMDVVGRLHITPRVVVDQVDTLSGGNQQKVVIGKWLLRGARIMLMYDLTRGVDVGTKREVYDLMRQFGAQGGGVLWYSTDILELIGVCDRIVVMHQGIAAPYEAATATPEEILSAMMGVQSELKGTT